MMLLKSLACDKLVSVFISFYFAWVKNILLNGVQIASMDQHF